MTEGLEITAEVLPTYFEMATKRVKEEFRLPIGFSLKKSQERLEEFLVEQALEETRGNKTQAAKLLEVSHRWLLYRLKKAS